MPLVDTRKAKTGVFSAGRALIAERTLRTDKWWLQPLLIVGALVAFIIYATFRAFEGKHYFVEPLVSPFYSPCLSTVCVDGSSLLGTPIGKIVIFGMVTWFPHDLLLLPQVLLPFILGFTICMCSC